MIVAENSYHCAGISAKGAGAEAGRRGGSGPVRRGNDFLNTISEASQSASEKSRKSTAETAGTSRKVSAQEEFSKNQSTTGEFIDEVTKDGRELSREEMLDVIAEHREEILKKLKNGDTGVKIPIGSMVLTEEEWEKLLDSFDKAQEEIQKNVREKSGEELPEKRPDTTVNGNKVLAPEDTGHDLKSLEELAGDTDVRGAEVKQVKEFEDYFPGMQVMTKVGDCNVSTGIWCRTDFPFWEYFKKGTSADALNNWQPSGPQPGMLDPKVQRNLSSIGPGKISIVIPEKLQAKMDADPAYAQEIYRKVARWKEDYDAWDNATAASLGMNVAEHQFSKSYCVQLDEDGNVGNFTVVSGGRITKSEKTVEDNWLKRRNAAILFHKMRMAKEGYTGLTGTAGIVSEAGEESPLSLLRATLAAETLLMNEEDAKRDKK